MLRHIHLSHCYFNNGKCTVDWSLQQIQMHVSVYAMITHRKLVHDCRWPTTTDFSTSLQGFCPAPLLLLRTLKADVVTGLESGQVSRKATIVVWRTNLHTIWSISLATSWYCNFCPLMSESHQVSYTRVVSAALSSHNRKRCISQHFTLLWKPVFNDCVICVYNRVRFCSSIICWKVNWWCCMCTGSVADSNRPTLAGQWQVGCRPVHEHSLISCSEERSIMQACP